MTGNHIRMNETLNLEEVLVNKSYDTLRFFKKVHLINFAYILMIVHYRFRACCGRDGDMPSIAFIAQSI